MSYEIKREMEQTYGEEAVERFDDYLRDCYGDTVNVAGFVYDLAEALAELDPIAYRVSMAVWVYYELNEEEN